MSRGYSSYITLGLSAFHLITMGFEKGYLFTKKIVLSIIDSHTPSTWIFAERNSLPWSQKNDVGMKNYVYPMVYNPDTLTFLLDSRTSRISSNFGDVVTVELVNSDKILWHDMSSFFHQVSWGAYGNLAPSLYEFTLVFCLSKNLVFTHESMKTFYLNIFTAEGKEYHVPLSVVEGMADFSGWKKFEKYLVTSLVDTTKAVSIKAVSSSLSVVTQLSKDFSVPDDMPGLIYEPMPNVPEGISVETPLASVDATVA